MFYIKDFQTLRKNKIFSATDKNSFSVILSKNSVKKTFCKYSIAVAAKPLIRFSTLFGSQLIRYKKNNIVKLNLSNKFYSLCFLFFYVILSTVIMTPLSWRYTNSDVPLNILTKTYGVVNIAESIYSVFSVAFLNTGYYVRLFGKLDGLDNHYGASKIIFTRRRIISIIMIVIPLLQVFFTFWLRKFNWKNTGAHISFFLIMLQGSILHFLILSIYINHLMLNTLLMKRIRNTMSKQKRIVVQDSICDVLIKTICIPSVMKNEIKHFSWFELMQMYDKLGDCIHIFNNIYCGQVFIMYNSWLLCTMLLICRSLSPTIKYSEVFLSDLFVYSCINSRPIFLASMCEMFIRERKRTLSLLLHVLLSPGRDAAYVNQVQTMIMLVASRKLEISANVFTVNVPTVMNFAGRIISYTVLMIQYFYSRVFIQ